MKICFATNNRHKLQEIQNKLGKAYDIISLSDLPAGQAGLDNNEELPETHDTLEENSLEKAQYIYDKHKVNCFADDTGLLVEALDGAPGVMSARYAGETKSSEDNINLLLHNLRGVENRNAKFITVITLILDGAIYQFTGEVHGTITESKRGKNGFGYDPIFVPEGLQKTFAELDLEDKNKISHRARAVAKLVEFLKTISL
jgi:XTP/dITP diphosphohydrolase